MASSLTRRALDDLRVSPATSFVEREFPGLITPGRALLRRTQNSALRETAEIQAQERAFALADHPLDAAWAKSQSPGDLVLHSSLARHLFSFSIFSQALSSQEREQALERAKERARLSLGALDGLLASKTLSPDEPFEIPFSFRAEDQLFALPLEGALSLGALEAMNLLLRHGANPSALCILRAHGAKDALTFFANSLSGRQNFIGQIKNPFNWQNAFFGHERAFEIACARETALLFLSSGSPFLSASGVKGAIVCALFECLLHCRESGAHDAQSAEKTILSPALPPADLHDHGGHLSMARKWMRRIVLDEPCLMVPPARENAPACADYEARRNERFAGAPLALFKKLHSATRDELALGDELGAWGDPDANPSLRKPSAPETGKIRL